jgi:hypothetical protein
MAWESSKRSWGIVGMKNQGSSNPAWKGGRTIIGGYPVILIHGHHRADPNGYVKEHLVIAEKALGKPLLSKHPVHHFNDLKADNANTNLVICENNAYHKLLHARQRIVRLGGDPNVVKKCGVCKQLIDKADFHANAAMPDGLNQNCKVCTRRLANERYVRR